MRAPFPVRKFIKGFLYTGVGFVCLAFVAHEAIFGETSFFRYHRISFPFSPGGWTENVIINHSNQRVRIDEFVVTADGESFPVFLVPDNGPILWTLAEAESEGEKLAAESGRGFDKYYAIKSRATRSGDAHLYDFIIKYKLSVTYISSGESVTKTFELDRSPFRACLFYFRILDDLVIAEPCQESDLGFTG